ncbi:MAG: HEAT repeat domain-containing protein [Acidimicrobiales bacterium]|nr:HEAT repeat domain-containing protein [Acidimicrobiales bacterium]
MPGFLVFILSLSLLVIASLSYLILGAAADSRSQDSHRRRQIAIDAFATVLFAESDDVTKAFHVKERFERDTLIEVVSSLPIHMGDDGRKRLRSIIETPRTDRTFSRQVSARRWSRRVDAARLSGLIGSPADRAALLRDDHFAVRGVALAALSPQQVGEHADDVAAALLDPEPSVRAIAAGVLPSGGGACTMPLSAILAATSIDRRAALLAAAHITDRTLLGVLHLHARCDHPENRVLAANALAHQSPAEAESILLEMLRDPDSAVRVAAIAGLSRIGGVASLVPLRGLLDDPSWTVRTAAEKALTVIGPAGSMLLRQQNRKRAELPPSGSSGRAGIPAPVHRQLQVKP